jgi:hypothetical protein
MLNKTNQNFYKQWNLLYYLLILSCLLYSIPLQYHLRIIFHMSIIVMTSLIAKPIKILQVFYIIRLATKCTFCKMLHSFFFGHAVYGSHLISRQFSYSLMGLISICSTFTVLVSLKTSNEILNYDSKWVFDVFWIMSGIIHQRLVVKEKCFMPRPLI